MDNSIKFLEQEKYDLILTHMPNPKVCSNLAYFYSVFCDPTRIKVIIALSICEMCVNDLAKLLSINQTTISHQLKILRGIGVVEATKKNKFTFYKITDKYVNDTMINGMDYLLSKKAG